MSKFRDLAQSYRSNIKLTPDDKEPLDLWRVEASTRKIKKEYKLGDRVFLDNIESRTFLAFEEVAR